MKVKFKARKTTKMTEYANQLKKKKSDGYTIITLLIQKYLITAPYLRQLGIISSIMNSFKSPFGRSLNILTIAVLIWISFI